MSDRIQDTKSEREDAWFYGVKCDDCECRMMECKYCHKELCQHCFDEHDQETCTK